MGFVIAFTEFHSWGRISSLIAFALGLVLKSGIARVPEDERLRIVELYTKEYSQRAVVAMVKRPLKTMIRIIRAFGDENRIKDAPRKPRPRVITQEDDMNIVAYVADNPRASLSEIRQCFQLTASKTTVKRRLAEAGLKSRMAAQKPLLTNVNKSKHLSFAQRHEVWSANDWGRVVFSDECTFTTKWDQRARVWRPDRTRFRPQFVQRVAASGRTVGSAWGCITCDGLGPLVRIQGALTADIYSNILDTVGFPHITSHITPQHDCIFQHDRSPVHTAKKLDRLLQQRGVTVLMDPPQSPDLNVIENVWGRMKTTLSRLSLHGKSVDDLWAAVNEEWERLKCDSSFTEALYRSLPERMKAVVGR
ncbi:hypothetical protein HPB49_007093 [Dermacentor silvarum]|uniref:Uncharacterized protein n=1 Tax=Dermacentor silvarum TaxID=543639 RepID=A0ACB8DWE4_DERSI|nr:hypothetical protein HPB49_007093 [Dermacentor silvarum]